MIPSLAIDFAAFFAVYQRGLVIDSQHGETVYSWSCSISKGIGD